MKLEEIRQEIDRIDQALVPLIEQRIAWVTKVAKVKKETEAPIFDEVREKKVLEKVGDLVENSALREVVKASFQALMDVSRDYQKREMKD